MKRTKTSDAAKRAAIKYMEKNIDKFTISAPKGRRAAWQEAADHAEARSLTAWIISTLDDAAAVELDGQPEPAEKKTETGSQVPADGQPASPEA